MSQFLFYNGDNPQLIDQARRAATSRWGEISEVSSGSFWLFLPKADCADVVESPAALGAVSGYVRRSNGSAEPAHGNSSTAHNTDFIQTILRPEAWPLDTDWTGTFAAVAYSRSTGDVFLCTDLVGFLPIYYSVCPFGLVGGTSLIALSHTLALDVDPVGVVEQITTFFCSYGRRTILKRVERLLAGECIQFTGQGIRAKSRFDNSLYGDMVETDLESAARQLWDCLVSEVALAIGGQEHISLALSGGWDSRLILGAAAQNHVAMDCYTYGRDDLYEAKLAARCARSVHASHQCFPIEGKYFPPREGLDAIVRATEAEFFPQWWSILDGVGPVDDGRRPILMGDLTDVVDGRNMVEITSRSGLKRAYIKGLLGISEPLRPATRAAFEQWKSNIRRETVESIVRGSVHLAPDVAVSLNESVLRDESAADLELSFSRVEDNQPPFAAMFDEVFRWHHRVRFWMASQALCLGYRFRPRCPTMSLRFMRMASSIHPRLRLRRRLFDAMARLPELHELAQIPTAAIPWVGGHTPALLREFIWGARSGVDQILTARAMRKKNVHIRRRILPSLDFVAEYQRENVDSLVQSWFSGRSIRADRYVERVRQRARLETWPFVNVDISIPACISLLLDACEIGRSTMSTPRVACSQ